MCALTNRRAAARSRSIARRAEITAKLEAAWAPVLRVLNARVHVSRFLPGQAAPVRSLIVKGQRGQEVIRLNGVPNEAEMWAEMARAVARLAERRAQAAPHFEGGIRCAR